MSKTQTPKRKRGRPRVADPRTPFYLPLGRAEYNRLRAVAARAGREARPWARDRLMEVVATVERQIDAAAATAGKKST